VFAQRAARSRISLGRGQDEHPPPCRTEVSRVKKPLGRTLDQVIRTSGIEHAVEALDGDLGRLRLVGMEAEVGLQGGLKCRTGYQCSRGACNPHLHGLALYQRRLNGAAGDPDRHGPTFPAHTE
jgi:hypothetical protein